MSARWRLWRRAIGLRAGGPENHGPSQLLYQGNVLHVTRFHCGHLGDHRPADEVEVSHEIEHFVAGELVVETKLCVDDLLVVHEDDVAHDVADAAAWVGPRFC